MAAALSRRACLAQPLGRFKDPERREICNKECNPMADAKAMPCVASPPLLHRPSTLRADDGQARCTYRAGSSGKGGRAMQGVAHEAGACGIWGIWQAGCKRQGAGSRRLIKRRRQGGRQGQCFATISSMTTTAQRSRPPACASQTRHCTMTGARHPAAGRQRHE